MSTSLEYFVSECATHVCVCVCVNFKRCLCVEIKQLSINFMNKQTKNVHIWSDFFKLISPRGLSFLPLQNEKVTTEGTYFTHPSTNCTWTCSYTLSLSPTLKELQRRGNLSSSLSCSHFLNFLSPFVIYSRKVTPWGFREDGRLDAAPMRASEEEFRTRENRHYL